MKQNSNGMGIYQQNQANEARQSIYEAMSDGEWHRNIELKKTTQLSSRTLAKHIEQMVKLQLMERKEDIESKKYPIPVFYRLTPLFVNDYIKPSKFRKQFSENIEAMLEETNDPLLIFDMVNNFCQVFFIQILKEIQTNKKIPDYELDYLEEVFLWYNYKYCTMYIIAATSKIIDKIDIDQLLVSQAKRQKEIWELVIKRHEELNASKK